MTTGSVLVHSTSTNDAALRRQNIEAMQFVHACTSGLTPQELGIKPRPACSNKYPEPHERGEFPMSCYPCHMVADA